MPATPTTISETPLAPTRLSAAAMKARADAIALGIRAINSDTERLRLQTEFFEASNRPSTTR